MLEAALIVIQRDGPGRLTLEAIARESGLSKGGLMHQFRTKQAVLRELLEHQHEYFEIFSQEHILEIGGGSPEALLSAEIATAREAITMRHSVALAILGAAAEDPNLLSVVQASAAEKIRKIREEATDPDLSTIRWLAARGLAFTTLLGICPLAAEDRERLFERLMDHEQWQSLAASRRAAGNRKSPRRKGER
ncbi:TetR/AcrR family transcriptional regulator [Roseomonas chloroacetimidivorans]|uniref:TetR/AcrR family transcriptional regulator n=1 Tax=Roseomonas chloroacetimidivorans TaxID=1766656 RepID=UPI003C791A63